mmetsp:Transcript_48693/g.115719  ORF Transcript_48693/g.115719 Transcript_48693/m.115719 type:complete len:245 (-) Transcript_48693:1314-2048(-)
MSSRALAIDASASFSLALTAASTVLATSMTSMFFLAGGSLACSSVGFEASFFFCTSKSSARLPDSSCGAAAGEATTFSGSALLLLLLLVAVDGLPVNTHEGHLRLIKDSDMRISMDGAGLSRIARALWAYHSIGLIPEAWLLGNSNTCTISSNGSNGIRHLAIRTTWLVYVPCDGLPVTLAGAGEVQTLLTVQVADGKVDFKILTEECGAGSIYIKIELNIVACQCGELNRLGGCWWTIAARLR